MHIVRNCLDPIREFNRVGNKSSLVVSGPLTPAVVHNDIFIARLRQSFVNDRIGRGSDQILTDLIIKCVP